MTAFHGSNTNILLCIPPKLWFPTLNHSRVVEFEEGALNAQRALERPGGAELLTLVTPSREGSWASPSERKLFRGGVCECIFV